jgi:hypothetical protein
MEVKFIFRLVAIVTLILLAGWLLWFELVTVPTILARHLELSLQSTLIMGSWQLIKLGLVFILGTRLGRKGVFDTYAALIREQIAPLTYAITNLHRDVNHSANTTVGRAVLDGAKLGVRLSGDIPQMSRTELLAGLDHLALPPVTGRWEIAGDEQTELEAYKNNIH